MNIPFIPVLDHLNLAFHEAGHIFFGIFGVEFLTLAGGTLMQLLMPLSALLYFYKKEEPLAVNIILLWFGENFLNIGTYMKDALVQELPLVGGGMHDWTYMFGELKVITSCVKIGNATILVGFAIMIYALVKIASRVLGSRA